jgi:recombination protein RecT
LLRNLGECLLGALQGHRATDPGYRGLIDLCKRSGEVSSIYAHTVHEKDKFEIELGSTQKITHVPYTMGDRGEVVSVYAVAVLKDGAVQFDYMTKSDVDAIRRRSRAGQTGPWQSDFAEMAKKTVVRRLVKYLPISTDLERAVELEDRDADLSSIEVMDDMTAAATQVATPAEEPAPPDVPFK